MKIQYTSATGCPVGQFIVTAENEQERAMLSGFINLHYHPRWRFRVFGSTSQMDLPGGIKSFNFGLADRDAIRPPGPNSTGPSIPQILIAWLSQWLWPNEWAMQVLGTHPTKPRFTYQRRRR